MMIFRSRDIKKSIIDLEDSFGNWLQSLAVVSEENCEDKGIMVPNHGAYSVKVYADLKNEGLYS